MTPLSYPVELLAPAKDLACGIAAINHGADAVYIGACNFGARKMAANSTADIAKLAQHAHLYRARVYVTVNTLLYNSELDGVQALIYDLYNAGADAIIVQDMGILQMNLPPIALHASTQTDNRTIEKVKFMEDAGFRQVVLARELSLEQIAAIRQQTRVQLECFIHGALCVSYSGKCYMSHAATKRSANRGECSQMCRLPYSLETLQGKTIAKDKYLLSLKDLNLSEHIEKLIDAGISSFKIEGRLKDAGYVKNITAYYRQILDTVLKKRPELARSSTGRSIIEFTPAPEKSFSRGFTSCFVDGRQRDVCSPDTPKSTGEKIGTALKIEHSSFTLKTDKELNNGDGLCFFNSNGELTGIKVNRAENAKVFVANTKALYTNAVIYRNYSHQFSSQLEASNGNRKIGLHIAVSETVDGVKCVLTDEDGIVSVTCTHVKKEQAVNAAKAEEQIKAQLSKLGNTPFYLLSAVIELQTPMFLQASVINGLRRSAVDSHRAKRMEQYARVEHQITPTYHRYPEQLPVGESNVLNNLARTFYQQHGAGNIPDGFELLEPAGMQCVMTAKHCIRHVLGICPKENRLMHADNLVLKSAHNKYLVKFECKKCEMHIFTF
ncbi:MAG: U32 family peptidase [Cytophagaceae bacterium]|jgi:putative protease|nr:U32 family peptidase [Cytophagaceae bacterium]